MRLRSPKQNLPLYLGSGCVHHRSALCTPMPQLREQTDQALQSDQLPSTGSGRKPIGIVPIETPLARPTLGAVHSRVQLGVTGHPHRAPERVADIIHTLAEDGVGTILEATLVVHVVQDPGRHGREVNDVGDGESSRHVPHPRSRNLVMYSLLQRDQVSGAESYRSCGDMMKCSFPTGSQSLPLPS